MNKKTENTPKPTKKSAIKSIKLADFARFDRAHCLARIFAPKRRGLSGKPFPFEIVYRQNAETEYTFTGRRCPGYFELAILQGLVGIAGFYEKGFLLSEETENQSHYQLWLDLKIMNTLYRRGGEEGGDNRQKKDDAIMVGSETSQLSFFELFKQAGLTKGTEIKKAIDALRLLSEIKIYEKKFIEYEKITDEKGEEYFSYNEDFYEEKSSNLLNFYVNAHTKRFYVALNPFVARAFKKGNSYIRLNMDEARELTGSARILHHVLSGFVDYMGQKVNIALDTLATYLWWDYDHKDGKPYTQQEKDRRKDLRKMLEEIGSLDHWLICETDNPGSYSFKRVKKKPEGMPKKTGIIKKDNA